MHGLAAMAAGGFLIALIVGFLTGMFGIGGGFIMTPALIALLDVSGSTAVGTGMATILTTSSFALLNRRRTDTIDVRLAMTIVAGGVLGIGLGLHALEHLKHSAPLVINGRELEAVGYILMCAFAVLLLSIAGYLSFDHFRTGGQSPEKRVGLLAAVKVPPYFCYRSLEQTRLSVVCLIMLGVGIGLLTGLMGVGGGIVLLPALIYLVGQRTAKAAGTSLLIVFISSLVAVALNAKYGNVDLLLWAVMTAGGLIGASLGTRVGLRIAGHKFRVYFIYVVLAAFLLVCYRIVDMTFG
jgi:uncharacterized membrane protein YfcA